MLGEKPKAIDLYSGIGGWTLGLKMAGCEVVASYEWWKKANRTHNHNFGVSLKEVDIRQLELTAFPKGMDIVVGSPPCTQFSFSNRGGNGDIADGLVDIRKFLEVVDHVRPRQWAMENVPRVAKILEKELEIGGSLYRFRNLFSQISVVDMSDFGLPQNRRRMIAGDFSLELLNSYREAIRTLTLGEVIKSLNGKSIKDPIYGFTIPRGELTETEKEEYLTPEELRMNREAKTFHPVYNKMAFPDRLNRPARTVTAVCTRVSRESIVIDEPNSPAQFRRLSVRERASLQGFPITFQFYGDSYAEKLRMIGNAIPPLFTYYLAHSMLGTKAKDVLLPAKNGFSFHVPEIRAPRTSPETSSKKYPPRRGFRFAITNLRFGSGMRFDLSNSFEDGKVSWNVKFSFGSSKDIRTVQLDSSLLETLYETLDDPRFKKQAQRVLSQIREAIDKTDPAGLQGVWIHENAGTGPFDVVDVLGAAAESLVRESKVFGDEELEHIIRRAGLCPNGLGNGFRKIAKYSRDVIAGLLIGSWFNTEYGKPEMSSVRRPRERVAS